MVQTLPIGTDIVVQSADGRILALVEVRNREHLTPEIAATFRRNLIAHGHVKWWSKFFMIVSQDIGYLWEQDSLLVPEAQLPTVEFLMTSVVERYLPSFAGGPRLLGSQLELAVIQWLWDIANGVENRPKEPDVSLAKTDFLQLIKGGRVGAEFDV